MIIITSKIVTFTITTLHGGTRALGCHARFSPWNPGRSAPHPRAGQARQAALPVGVPPRGVVLPGALLRQGLLHAPVQVVVGNLDLPRVVLAGLRWRARCSIIALAQVHEDHDGDGLAAAQYCRIQGRDEQGPSKHLRCLGATPLISRCRHRQGRCHAENRVFKGQVIEPPLAAQQPVTAKAMADHAIMLDPHMTGPLDHAPPKQT